MVGYQSGHACIWKASAAGRYSIILLPNKFQPNRQSRAFSCNADGSTVFGCFYDEEGLANTCKWQRSTDRKEAISYNHLFLSEPRDLIYGISNDASIAVGTRKEGRSIINGVQAFMINASEKKATLTILPQYDEKLLGSHAYKISINKRFIVGNVCYKTDADVSHWYNRSLGESREVRTPTPLFQACGWKIEGAKVFQPALLGVLDGSQNVNSGLGCGILWMVYGF